MAKIVDTLITKPLKQLDNSTGKIFQISFYYILKISSIVVAVVGLYLIVSGFFGKTGYFATLQGYYSGFELIRSIICFILTLALNILMFLIVSGVLWFRADKLKNDEYRSVVFILPRLLKTAGEAIFALPAIASTISFVAIALAAIPYAPVEGLISLTGGISMSLINSFIGNTFSAIFVQNFQEYLSLLFSGGIMGLFTGYSISFLILIGVYIAGDLLEMLFKFLSRIDK